MFKKKFLTALIAFFSIFLFPSFAFAQLDSTVEDTTVDWDTEWEDLDYDYDYGLEDTDLATDTFEAVMGPVLLSVVVISIGFYIYMGITLNRIGKKLNYEKTWYAWVPILNFVMILELVDLSPWLILLSLVPIVNGIAMLVLSVITMMKICEKLGKDKLLGLLVLIPIGNLVLMGILAWGRDDGEVKGVEKRKKVEKT